MRFLAMLLACAACSRSIQFDVQKTVQATATSASFADAAVDLQQIDEVSSHWLEDFSGAQITSAELVVGAPTANNTTQKLSGRVTLAMIGAPLSGEADAVLATFTDLPIAAGQKLLLASSPEADRFMSSRLSVRVVGTRDPRFTLGVRFTPEGTADVPLTLTLHVQASY